MILLSTTYLGPIQYFSKFAVADHEVRIEACEHFQKQTYRNRAHVMTAGGVRALTVPVVWDHGAKMPIRDVRIDYTMPWQREHWRTLVAGYKAAPFFDHYAEKLAPFYDRKDYRPEFLFDLNLELTSVLLKMLGLPTEIRLTEDYLAPKELQERQGIVGVEGIISDYRDSISHKPRLQRSDPDFKSPVYHQVFEDRIPFAENLSIIDLIFCEGPQTLFVL